MTVIHSPATPSPDQGTPREARHCATCRCQQAAHRCQCGHLDVHHDLARDRRTRKACAWTSATDGRPQPCPCTTYTPAEVTHG